MSNPRKPSASRGQFAKFPRGFCQECGKSVKLRVVDGMIGKHICHRTADVCLGTGLSPSKAAGSRFIDKWEAPRRAE